MPDTLRAAVHQARTHIEEAVETREAPTLVEAKAIDEALAALDRLAETLDSAAFWSEHVQIIHVDIPAPLSVPRKTPAERGTAFFDTVTFHTVPAELPEKKHTIVGIGRRTWGEAAEAHCSCGWAVESTGHAYVGIKVAEHLDLSDGAGSKWADRANQTFAGFRP